MPEGAEKKMLEVDKTTLALSVLSLGIGLAIGLKLQRRRTLVAVGKNGKKMFEDLTDGAEGAMGDTGDCKMVLVVNNELKMGKGKIAAQCAHAAVGAVERASRHDAANLKQWRTYGQPKVVLKGESTALLKSLGQQAVDLGLVTCLIADAGRTQIAPGSKTVLAIGPGPAAVIDKVTGNLKLF